MYRSSSIANTIRFPSRRDRANAFSDELVERRIDASEQERRVEPRFDERLPHHSLFQRFDIDGDVR